MFTGLIEEVGTVEAWQHGHNIRRLTIKAEKIMDGIKVDDSVAVNGLCLTVTNRTKNTFTADVMLESMKKSNLEQLGPGDGVNLERALALGDRLGGHLVTGHIDGVGVVQAIDSQDNALILEIRAPQEVLHYVVEKGSITIDGVSLTVITHTEKTFQVGVIPHSAKFTTLGNYKLGDKVNLEGDLIGKYVEKFVRPHTKTGVSMDMLRENGFA